MIEDLMNTAEADANLLIQNNEKGDNFSIPRDVDFYFICDTYEKAEIVSGYTNDYNYGQANIQERDDGNYGVTVLINMPINQHIITPISGFMQVVANLFKVEYSGWGTVMQIEK